jgi:D-amino peptidase
LKIYIVTDMEGISLVFNWDQVTQGNPVYPRYQKILTAEVNAAIEGALSAGATTIIVNDGHGGSRGDYNLLWEGLHSSIEIVRMDEGILTGLDETFDAMLLVGHHAMEGTPNAILAHTQSREKWEAYFINGKMYGEIGQLALIAGGFGVPVAYVNGDFAAVEEARTLLGEDLPATIIKWGQPQGTPRSLHPLEAVSRIREDVEKALKLSQRQAFYFPGPYKITVKYKAIEFADQFNSNVELTREDDFTISKTVQSSINILDI